MLLGLTEYFLYKDTSLIKKEKRKKEKLICLIYAVNTNSSAKWGDSGMSFKGMGGEGGGGLIPTSEK